MCYRCDICQRPSTPGRPKRRHVVKRADGNIHRELAVCGECQFRIEAGTPLATLERTARNARMLWQSKQLDTHSITPATTPAPRQPAPMIGRNLFIERNRIQ